jgi:hypothetical protein
MVASEGNKWVKISLFEALLILIVTISIASLSMLVLNCFDSLHALIAGLVAFTLIILIFGARLEPMPFPILSGILLILMVASFFRVEPYLWLMGGQDQGLYVNMSAHYEREGSAFVKDRVRELFKDDLKSDYDQHQYFYKKIAATGDELKGSYPRKFDQKAGVNYFAMTLPGVYFKNLAQSEFVFQFYPLHPLWMSIAGKVLGDSNRVYSLVMFSLLTIVIFSLLAYELSGGKRLPALLVALFLALNPLHAFFSKFPVTEMVSLFFSSAGFYALIRFHKDADRGKRVFYLWLSAGLFACLFFTHISSFIYLPLFYLLLLIAQLYGEHDTGRLLVFYTLGILLLFAFSVLYGLTYSYPYFVEVYEQSFKGILGSGWAFRLKLLLFVSAIPPVIVALLKWRPGNGSVMLSRCYTVLKILGIFAFLCAVYRAYQLGFTAKYVGHWAYDDLWKMAASGWKSLSYANFVTFIAYLSPVAFICLILAFIRNKKHVDIVDVMLLFLIVVALYMRIVMAFTTPYSYYFARYQLSELVPYSLLVVALFLGQAVDNGQKRKKWSACFCIVAIAANFLYYTAFQLKGQEADGAEAALSRIAARLDDKSILLHDFTDPRIITPIRYYFGRNTFYTSDISAIGKGIYGSLSTNFNALYFLTTKKCADSNVELVDVIAYSEGVFEHRTIIPSRFSYERMNLYLYRIADSAMVNLFKEIKSASAVKRHFYDDNVWTDGNGTFDRVGYRIQPEDRYLVVVTNGWRPFKGGAENLALSVDGARLKYAGKKNNNYLFQLEKTRSVIDQIRIESATFVPKLIGLNDDIRRLGLDIDSIRIE